MDLTSESRPLLERTSFFFNIGMKYRQQLLMLLTTNPQRISLPPVQLDVSASVVGSHANQPLGQDIDQVVTSSQ